MWACATLLVFEVTAVKVVGRILLPFYVLVPIWRLRREAASVKLVVTEAAYGQSYQDSLVVFSKKAVESRISEVTAKELRREQRLSRDSPGYRASVAAVLIAPFEEKLVENSFDARKALDYHHLVNGGVDLVRCHRYRLRVASDHDVQTVLGGC